jgi:hypothetical protein
MKYLLSLLILVFSTVKAEDSNRIYMWMPVECSGYDFYLFSSQGICSYYMYYTNSFVDLAEVEPLLRAGTYTLLIKSVTNGEEDDKLGITNTIYYGVELPKNLKVIQ